MRVCLNEFYLYLCLSKSNSEDNMKPFPIKTEAPKIKEWKYGRSIKKISGTLIKSEKTLIGKDKRGHYCVWHSFSF